MATHARTLTAPAPPAMTHARRSTGPVTVDEAGSLYGRLVPWDVPAEVSDGAGHYTERFARGGLVADGAAGVIPVYDGHRYDDRGRLVRGPLVGRLDDVEALDDGLYGRVVLADVPEAARLRALARTVGATFSVEFTDTAEPAAEVVRTGARLDALAVMTLPDRGAYAGAEVLSVRSAPGDEDPDDPDDDDPGAEVDEGVEAEAATEPVAARAAIRREVERVLGRGVARMTPHPLARFDSPYDLFAAARASRSDELPRLFADAYHAHHARALVDQVTTNNPGVIPPAWLSEVFGILDMGRPVISAIGTRPLPPAGMEVDWPYYDGDLKTLVGQQTTEKTEIVSARVDLKKASVPLVTYAGGSDISWQLIRRSQPSYREAYLRIMQLAYSAVTDNAASDAIGSVAGGGHVEWDPSAADPDGTILRGAIFAASVQVQEATGAPASFVLAAPDVFVKFGGMPMLVPSSYGTQNVAGTATASTLDVSVSGLQVVLAPDLAAGTAIVSNRQAVSWFEDGPFVVSAQDVTKLGEDVAIWSMAAFAVFIAGGVVELSDTIPLTASRSTAKKKQ